MLDSSKQQEAIDRLCAIYTREPQIGLVLGAGVSKGSGVPLYKGLALRLVNSVSRDKVIQDDATPSTIDFLVKQLQSEQEIDPEKVLQYARNSMPAKMFLRLVWEAIYSEVPPPYRGRFKMLPVGTYKDNKTMNAIISFCSAKPGSPIAPESTGRWQTNGKVGGILTTNYDNLVEGCFNSKYRKLLLKPVPGEGAREAVKGKRVIPVYHMHGYLSYAERPEEADTAKWNLVIAEEDYYRTFYNLLGFSNVVAMSFLRRFSCIFVGCSMVDANIRRILFHLKRERISSSEIKEHFAILPTRAPGADSFDDGLLRSLGVTPIRIEGGQAIGAGVEAVLKQVYLSPEGFEDPKHWDEAKRGPTQRLKKKGSM